MVEFKFLVRLPIFVARQWIRHRTACLAEGTQIIFDMPGGVRRKGRNYNPIRVEDLWRRFQPTHNNATRHQRNPYLRRDRVREMLLRQLDEETRVMGHTHVVDVTKNGEKPVFRMTLDDGKSIECTADHRFLFEDGWGTLVEKTQLREVGGLAVWKQSDYRVSVNGTELARPALHQNRDRLEREYGGLPGGSPVQAMRVLRPKVAWNRLTVPRLVRVAQFEFIGNRMTYDLEVEGPSHNFVANGIVTHNSVNEYSARYSVVPDEYEIPPESEVRHQSTRNRQGRGDLLPSDVVERFRANLERISKDSYAAYTDALQAGVARETARLLLPVAYYTQWYWKCNLWNLFHFLSLRLDPHAQEEIRLYAAEMAKIARLVVPTAYEAFEEFTLSALSLSRREQVAVRALLDGKTPEAACEIAGLPLVREDGKPMTTGEGVEFLEKLEKLRSTG
jgi:flavin-dependent thymidylate synthase